MGAVFDTPIARAVVATLYILPSSAVLVGIKKKSWRRWGAFGVFIMYLFAALLRVVTQGFTPFIWVFILACGLISGIVYLYVSLKEESGGEDGLL